MPRTSTTPATAATSAWQRWRADAIRWVMRRYPHDGRSAMIGRDRVYILPTRQGYLLLAILIIMLLGAINYSNNMAFLLTFLVAGIGHNAMWYTHRNLLGLRVSLHPIKPVFAGTPPRLRLRLHDTAQRPREALHLRIGTRESHSAHLAPLGETDLELSLPALPRGHYHLPRQRLLTRYPLGLLEAWTWLSLDTEILVYPQPKAGSHIQYGSGESDHDAAPPPTASQRDNQGEPDQIRGYQPGDPPKRMVWKAVARSGRLVVREHSPAPHHPAWLDWDQVPGTDTEARLSLLCQWILERHAQHEAYGLRMPGLTIAPNTGPEHLAQCLRPLALFGQPTAPSPIPD